MSIIQIEVTEPFAEGWLRYLLGLPRPEGESDTAGKTAIQLGWDNAEGSRDLMTIRRVFAGGSPFAVSTDVIAVGPDPVLTNVGPDQQDTAKDIAKGHAREVAEKATGKRITVGE